MAIEMEQAVSHILEPETGPLAGNQHLGVYCNTALQQGHCTTDSTKTRGTDGEGLTDPLPPGRPQHLYAPSVLCDGAVRGHKRVVLGATECRELVVHVRVAGLQQGAWKT